MSENTKKYILITAALIVIGAALYLHTDPRGRAAA